MSVIGPTEMMIVLMYLVFLLIPLAVLYFIIRQAVLSALRKFYRELDEAGKQKIQD